MTPKFKAGDKVREIATNIIGTVMFKFNPIGAFAHTEPYYHIRVSTYGPIISIGPITSINAYESDLELIPTLTYEGIPDMSGLAAWLPSESVSSIFPTKIEATCECGCASIGIDKHSTWCPKCVLNVS